MNIGDKYKMQIFVIRKSQCYVQGMWQYKVLNVEKFRVKNVEGINKRQNLGNVVSSILIIIIQVIVMNPYHVTCFLLLSKICIKWSVL